MNNPGRRKFVKFIGGGAALIAASGVLSACRYTAPAKDANDVVCE